MRSEGVAYERDPYDMRRHELSNGLVIVNVVFKVTQNHCDALKRISCIPLAYEKTMVTIHIYGSKLKQ